ncbi:MAG: hypothetical protein R3Y28_03340 [Candidatus Gastranaerophilales bacterium]
MRVSTIRTNTSTNSVNFERNKNFNRNKNENNSDNSLNPKVASSLKSLPAATMLALATLGSPTAARGQDFYEEPPEGVVKGIDFRKFGNVVTNYPIVDNGHEAHIYLIDTDGNKKNVEEIYLSEAIAKDPNYSSIYYNTLLEPTQLVQKRYIFMNSDGTKSDTLDVYSTFAKAIADSNPNSRSSKFAQENQGKIFDIPGDNKNSFVRRIPTMDYANISKVVPSKTITKYLSFDENGDIVNKPATNIMTNAKPRSDYGYQLAMQDKKTNQGIYTIKYYSTVNNPDTANLVTISKNGGPELKVEKVRNADKEFTNGNHDGKHSKQINCGIVIASDCASTPTKVVFSDKELYSFFEYMYTKHPGVDKNIFKYLQYSASENFQTNPDGSIEPFKADLSFMEDW